MKLSIIVVNYNTQTLLQQTLDSIPAHSDWETIVVDNHSTDGSLDLLKKRYPKVKVISNAVNQGFAKANNQGITASTGEYLLLLNSDTKIQPQALETLVEFLDTHPEVGAATPKVVFPNGRLDPACHRGMPTPWRSFCYYVGLERLFPQSPLFGGYHQAYLDVNSVHPLETTAATAMMVRRQTITEIGLLDERFFLYGEDLDWCKRMTDANWQIMYLPTAVVVHFKSQSGKQHQSKAVKRQAQVYFYDTMKQFYEKHYREVYPKPLRQLVYLGIDIKKWLSTR